MALWAKWTLAGAEDAIEAFGRRLREGRHRASLTQMRLEELSGVDQSLISRLELGKAPHASLERVVRLGQALGDQFPLGYCPHEHRCLHRPDWQPPPWEGHLPYQGPPEPAAERELAAQRDLPAERELAAQRDLALDSVEPADDTNFRLDLRWTADGVVSVDDVAADFDAHA